MTSSNSSSNNSESDANEIMKLDLFHEHLRQAQVFFNLSVVTIATSLGISIIGAGLLISGKNQGNITTTTGLISTTLWSQIAKEAGEKLEQLRTALKD